METYERLRQLVEAAAEDVAKAEDGNKAAGTRVRKQMQEIKQVAQAVRNGVLEMRSAKGGDVTAPVAGTRPPTGATPAF